MGILDIFKRNKKSMPMSLFINSGMMSSVVSKPDAMDLFTGWVYACIDRRSKGLAAIEFKLYEVQGNGEVEEILEHELLELLNKVNPSTTKFDIMQLSTIYSDIFGASPWLLDGGKGGRIPDSIHLLRPEYLSLEMAKNGAITRYKYEIGDVRYYFEPEEVIYLRNHNPRDPNKGLGVIEAARLAAQHNDYIKQHNTKLLENGARPSGTLTVEGGLSPQDRKRLKSEFKDQYQGYDNAYKLMLLEGGMKFDPISIPPKDLEFLEASKMNMDEILSVFGVPKPILGVFEDVNRASAVTAEYIFAKWTLEPMAIKFVEQLNEFLVPRYGDNLWLWFEPLALEDDEAVMMRREKAWNKWRTTNEIRAEEGLEPLKGGDTIYMSMANMPYMSPDAQKEMVKVEGNRPNIAKVDYKTQKQVKKRVLNRNVKLKRLAKEAGDKQVDKLIKKKKVLFKLVDKKSVSDEQIESFYKLRMSEEPALESLWEKRFKDFFEAQKGRFLGKIDSKKSAVSDYDIDVEEELKATIDIINPLLYETVMKGTQHAAALIGERAIMDMDFIKEWLDGVAEKSGKSINETTIEAFGKAVKESIEAGEGVAGLKTRVEDLFEDFKGYRAEMIARTETARGVTEAHRKMYEYYGFDEVKWLLSPGACDICIVEAKKEWTVKSIEGMIPSHPMCRCDHVPL
jgi:HK97 family phage portal protein